MANRISLGDDGTMDTVFVCDECGEEMRSIFDADFPDDNAVEAEEAEEAYQLFGRR